MDAVSLHPDKKKPPSTQTTSILQVDRAGAACSTVCAVHCASTAFIPSALAAVGLGTLAVPAFEWGFTAVAILFGVAALVLGWRKHRVLWIGLVLAIGIVGLGVARLLEASGVEGVGPALAVFSGVALAAGHLANLRANKRG